jgi:tetratricopeptide (TPR) repeat protein
VSVRASSIFVTLLLAAGGCLPPAASGADPATRFDAQIARLEARHASDPRDADTIYRLGEALLARLRTSGDARDAARAESLAAQAVATAPKSPNAWRLKAWTEMSAHRFEEALAAARKAQGFATAPHPITLGLLADALVELGKYTDAIAATQKLLDEFPGVPAYTRAAHLRFLHGDLEGAISLMRTAAKAGRPRSEEAAWSFVQLSELYLHRGMLGEAEQAVQTALSTYPGLPQGDAQLARVRETQGQFDEALTLYGRAAQSLPNADLVYALWQLAVRQHRADEAARHAALLDGLARLDEKTGLYRRTFALYFAERGNHLEAERLARIEARRRPDIYSHDTLAWVLYRAGKAKQATEHAREALKLGTPDVALQIRAAAIFAAAGDKARGDRLLREAQGRAPQLAALEMARLNLPNARVAAAP